MRVGLIGAGRMGVPMGRHWLCAGHALAVYDPRAGAADELLAAGATLEASPAAVAARSDLIVILVGYPTQVDECMEGEGGVLAGMAAQSIVVISSTTEPEQVQRLAAAARRRGADVLDGPTARAEQAAISANLLWFIGGASETLDRARDVLAVCGRDIHHVGDIGAGQVAKAVNNMLLWAAVESNREGFALAAAFGVDEVRLRAALLESSAASWAMAHWELMGVTPWAHKDLVLTTAMGDQAGLSMPVAGMLREQVKQNWAERRVELPPAGAARRSSIAT